MVERRQQYSWQKMSAGQSLAVSPEWQEKSFSEGVGDTSNDSMLESPASGETKIWDEHPRSKRVSLNTIWRHRSNLAVAPAVVDAKPIRKQ